MSAIDVRYERKSAVGHIKKIASARASSLSESDESVSIPRMKKAKTGVSGSHKS